METDRELLELAAKAAGINPLSVACGPGTWWDSESRTTYTCWNPFEDDGDALRLAASLEISVTLSSEFVNAIATQHGDDGVVPFAHESWTISNQDCYAATRRAIVRCAAEIGRTM